METFEESLYQETNFKHSIWTGENLKNITAEIYLFFITAEIYWFL